MERISMAHLQLPPNVTLERAKAIKQDEYRITQSYRPTTLRLLMAEGGVLTPLPILATYMGRETGHLQRFELYL